MEYRTLGSSGLRISAIGFGTGGTSGLMGRGEPEDQRAVTRYALDQGINYFDTAPGYDATKSEASLGRTLQELGARPLIGTKVRVRPQELGDISGTITRSVGESLERLRIDCIDLIQVHNRIALDRRPNDDDVISVKDAIGPGGVLEALKRLRDDGKVRYFGFTGIGEVPALNELIDSGEFHSVQAYYNLLNPSAGFPVPVAFRGCDYGRIIDHAGSKGMGVLIIRPLAAGALTDALQPHPLALTGGWASRAWYEVEADKVKSRAMSFLIENGRQTMVQAALRFALMKQEASSVLVGFTDKEQIDQGLSALSANVFTDEDMKRLGEMYHAD
ncbi:MAG TPA: aldo/keto reductase [Dehalococcoidia bacterium]|nr:aldo/keto reductase [Dehalococcoidia bacterium]